jgi:hypothetical protein
MQTEHAKAILAQGDGGPFYKAGHILRKSKALLLKPPIIEWN